MFIINVLDIISALEITQYIFGAFAFFGVMLCIKKLSVGG